MAYMKLILPKSNSPAAESCIIIGGFLNNCLISVTNASH
uniref:Uncharacterized protein n=1 Tax=Schistosoma curassoni TaxID=6186 RepID=A0A183KNL4_9TREM